ncbi:hypothetical protein AC626_23535 [Pseudoalteromonas rubra]|uniref:Porin domain-containing protein n=1 Tax=Pseudoalteromonas rubra TaxID=43658 RepID=A0A0L0EN89_9GAMM|nr:hypothetical protein AC626_23535 [Pseudoalteromonas rubra]
MNCNYALKWVIGGALVTSSFASYADVVFNGFASLRATAADSDGGTSPFETLEGTAISRFLTNLFCASGTSGPGGGLSATVQLLAEGKGDFDAEARWAYVSYEINPQHTISMGRFANPSFYQSEYQNVGYTHNFGRLPKAVYIGFDFTTIEGVSLDSNFILVTMHCRPKYCTAAGAERPFWPQHSRTNLWLQRRAVCQARII